eukprot:gene40859-6137_t
MVCCTLLRRLRAAEAATVTHEQTTTVTHEEVDASDKPPADPADPLASLLNTRGDDADASGSVASMRRRPPPHHSTIVPSATVTDA